jgi:hypothetical protein
MSAGVLIFKGMSVGFLPGDFELSLDSNGNVNSKAILSTSYNVIPIWLHIANNHFNSAKAASENLKSNWNDSPDVQKALLISELVPSMQVIVACGIALDALYDLLRPHAKISQRDIESWKKNSTSRGTQIAEIIRRVYKIKGNTLKKFKETISEIIKARDLAVHPANELKNAVTRADITVGVDWKFSTFRFENASNCFYSTMKMFRYLHANNCTEVSVYSSIANIFLALQELGVIE